MDSVKLDKKETFSIRVNEKLTSCLPPKALERSLTEKSGGFIKDPIHGYVRISETERSIIDTRPVQRLRRIRQLAGSEFVYPAANRTGLDHLTGPKHLPAGLVKRLPVDVPDGHRDDLAQPAL